MQGEKKDWISDFQIEEAANLFRTLAEPTRLKLIRELMAGPRTVGELVEATSLKQGNVSKHLGMLHAARLLKRSRSATFVHYSIADNCLYQICSIVCGKLETDAKERFLLLKKENIIN